MYASGKMDCQIFEGIDFMIFIAHFQLPESSDVLNDAIDAKRKNLQLHMLHMARLDSMFSQKAEIAKLSKRKTKTSSIVRTEKETEVTITNKNTQFDKL